MKLSLEARIEHYEGILRNTAIDNIDRQIREIELKAARETIQRANYSDDMQRRILKQARAVRLSKPRIAFIETLREEALSFDPKLFEQEYKIPVGRLLNDINDLLKQKGPASLIHIEHDVSPDRVYVQAYRSKDGDKYANEIGFWDSAINFTSLWGLTVGKKYDQISEYLEMIFVDGEEEYAFIHLFQELAQIRGYKILKTMLQGEPFIQMLRNMNTTPDFSIQIAEHGLQQYVIYNG